MDTVMYHVREGTYVPGQLADNLEMFPKIVILGKFRLGGTEYS